MVVRNIKWDTDGDKEVFDSLPQEWCFRIISPLQTTKARRNSLTMCLTG